jgi:hypothetical protein
VKKLDDPTLALGAARALASLGTRQGMDTLLSAAGKGNGHALYSLAILGARDAVPGLIKLLDDPKVAADAAGTLGDLRAKEAAPAIRKLLKSPDSRTRGIASWALGCLGDVSASPEILPLLEEDEWTVLDGAIGAVSLFGMRNAVPRIAMHLDHPDPTVRLAAVRALGRLGIHERLPEIRRLLHDRTEYVRVSVLEALDELRAESELPAVRRLLYDDSQKTRVAAAAWLCLRGSRDGVEVLLDESTDLGPMNALRNPKEWDRFHRSRLTWTPEGKARELLERIAKEAGLALELPQGPDDATWLGERRRIHSIADRLTLEEGLRELLEGRYDVVVEPGRMKVLGHSDALAFWESWRDSERKK